MIDLSTPIQHLIQTDGRHPITIGDHPLTHTTGRDGKQHQHYKPTQYITEFMWSKPKEKQP